MKPQPAGNEFAAFIARSGPPPTIGSSVIGEVPTKPPYAPWPSSGSESSIAGWQDRTPYDESTYLNALKRRGSPLLSSIAGVLRTLASPPQGVNWAKASIPAPSPGDKRRLGFR